MAGYNPTAIRSQHPSCWPGNTCQRRRPPGYFWRANMDGVSQNSLGKSRFRTQHVGMICVCIVFTDPHIVVPIFFDIFALLQGKGAPYLVSTMHDAGVTLHMGLPELGASRIAELARVHQYVFAALLVGQRWCAEPVPVFNLRYRYCSGIPHPPWLSWQPCCKAQRNWKSLRSAGISPTTVSWAPCVLLVLSRPRPCLDLGCARECSRVHWVGTWSHLALH